MRETQHSTLRCAVALLSSVSFDALMGVTVCVLVSGSRVSRPQDASLGADNRLPLGSVRPGASLFANEYGDLRLTFEPNRGQTLKGIKFIARGANSTFLLMPARAVFTFQVAENGSERGGELQPRPSRQEWARGKHPTDDPIVRFHKEPNFTGHRRLLRDG
jgi:hypothetical protein